jgi:hypothetical protein
MPPWNQPVMPDMADKNKDRPTFLQAFLIMISGAALAFFCCVGFLSGTNRTSTQGMAALTGIGFAVGALMVVAGLGLLAFLIIRAIVRAISTPAPAPADPGNPPSTPYGGTQHDSNDQLE